MIKIFSSIGFLFLLTSCISDPNNRPSPLVVEKYQLGDASIEIRYSSPAVKDRQIFGMGPDYLEQFNEVWRTGANEATTFVVDKAVVIDSNRLDPGKYALFTIPRQNDWTIIFSKDWDQWGSYDYDEASDVLRIEVSAEELSKSQERMKLFMENDSLKFRWERTSWSLPILNLP